MKLCEDPACEKPLSVVRYEGQIEDGSDLYNVVYRCQACSKEFRRVGPLLPPSPGPGLPGEPYRDIEDY